VKRQQPHDQQAELALCGAAFVDGGVLDAIDVQPEHFFNPRLARLWSHMHAIRARNVPLDEVTLLDSAPAGVDLELIADVGASTGTSRNAAHYAEIVRRHALTRQVLVAASEIVARAQEGTVDGKELLDEAMAAITRIDVGRPASTITIREVIKRRMRELDQLAAARAQGLRTLLGITTGIPRLDSATGGWPLGLVSIVAARPGMGKSAFLLQAENAASEAGHGVHVISIEDTMSMYSDRALSQESGVPGEAFRMDNGRQMDRLEKEEFLHGASRLFGRKNWLYEDVVSINAEDIVRAVRRSRATNNTKLVVVDYLQLVKRPKRYENIHDSIFQTISVLADAARQDGIAYVIASQLNRKVEERQDKRPQLSDLRDSGSIEERAKLVLGLYRGAKYGDPKAGVDFDPREGEPIPRADDWHRRLDVLLLKHSQGGDGYVRCTFDGPTMRIRQEVTRDRG
jgi:replicative DNA helicase